MKAAIFSCVAGVLSAFVLVSGAPAAPTPDPLFPMGLNWKPGTTCTYDIVHNGKKARWTFTVSEASGDKVMGIWTRDASSPVVSVPVVKTEKGLKFTEDMNMIHGAPMTAEPGYQWLAFPLEPGKSWEGRSVVSGTDAASKPWKVDVTYNSTLKCFYFAFGTEDLIVICDLPDNISAVAFSLAINNSGMAKGKVTVLVTMDEVDAAVKKTPSYRPPGQQG